MVVHEQNVNIPKCFLGYHSPSVVIYNRKRSPATRRGRRTSQGQLFINTTAARVVIVRSFSRNKIVRVVIVRCCPTKDRFHHIGGPLTTIFISVYIHTYISINKVCFGPRRFRSFDGFGVLQSCACLGSKCRYLLHLAAFGCIWPLEHGPEPQIARNGCSSPPRSRK